MEDHEIIELYWKRSEKALTETSWKYGPYCRAIAGNILGNWQDVEECLNDTWLAVWNSIPPQRPKRLSVYIGSITRNFALNRLKSTKARKRGSGQAEAVLDELRECIAGEDMEQQLEEMVLRDAVDDFLRSQPPRKRAVFLRRYWAMERIDDIALDLGMSRGQAATILYRMRKQLKKHLEMEGIAL